MAARAEGAWHAQGHCVLGGGRGHQRAGESPSPSHSHGSSPRTWPGAPGEGWGAGGPSCLSEAIKSARPAHLSALLRPHGSWYSRASPAWPARGCDPCQRPRILPTASTRAGPGRLSKADSRGPARQVGASACLEGTGAAGTSPLCHHRFTTSQTAPSPPPLLPSPCWKECSLPTLAVPGGLPGGGVNSHRDREGVCFCGQQGLAGR